MGLYSLYKKADGGVANDAYGKELYEKLPVVGHMSSLGGTLHGLIAGVPDREDLAEMDKHPEYSYMPGVGASRLIRKALATVKNDQPRRTLLSEKLGPYTSSIILAAAAAGAAGMAYGNKASAILGGIGGLAAGKLANYLGSRLGKNQKRRTMEEQEAADKGNLQSLSYLLPGVASWKDSRREVALQRQEDLRNAGLA